MTPPDNNSSSGSASSPSLRLAVAQMQPRLADLPANLDALEHFVERAVEADADLLVTPELALTGYPVGSWFSSAAIGRGSVELERLQRLSRRIPMIVGLIEETEEIEFFNSAIYLEQGHVRHLHRKVYLPTYREFDERRYFMGGWSVSAFDTPWCRMGVLICGDAWHLGLPYLLAHDGADVLVVIAASAVTGLTLDISSQEAWDRMNRSYALTLSNFVVFANQVGNVDGTEFWGGSQVIRPDGSMSDQASFDREELLVADLDLTRIRKQRLVLPFRRDDSLALTTDLGREVLLRKGRRVRGLAGARIPTGEATGAPPVGVSDLASGGPGSSDTS